jgi:hypothetical protein
MSRFTLALAIMLLLPEADAQDLPLEEQPEIRHYTVEIIVFSYNEDISTGTEVFPADAPKYPDTPPDVDDEFDAEAQIRDQGQIDTEVVKRELELVPLRTDGFTLTDTMRRLELLDAYEPLMHFGWTQPTYPLEETPAIRLRAFGRTPTGLDGSFTLYLSRFLHLVVDLALDAPHDATSGAILSETDSEVVFRFGDSRAQNEADYSVLNGPVRYRIRENRIFRSGELRYFDHPKFGVIAKITRFEVPLPDDESATAAGESVDVTLE